MIHSCLSWRQQMRTTLALDDELVTQAQAYTGLHEKSALVREALKALVEREAARRLARLGGTEPQLRPAPRRRSRGFWSILRSGSNICGGRVQPCRRCCRRVASWRIPS